MGARIITVTSGKGGVGKTTTTAHIAAALAKRRQKVAVIDADIGLRNLDVVLGLENRIVYDLVDVVEGRCRIEQALVKDKRVDGLYLLPAAQTRDKTAVNPAQMVALCQYMRPAYDFIMIDSPAGIEQGYRNAIAPADEILLITTPDISAVRDADRVIGLLAAASKATPKLIVNRLQPKMVAAGNMLDVQDVVSSLAIPLIGVIPDDPNILIASNRGTPITLNGKAAVAQAYHNIAARILGEEVPFMDLSVGGNVFKRLFRVFG